MIEASIDNAEADFEAAQLAGARVDADAILIATAKAQENEAWIALSEDERKAITAAINRLQLTYHAPDHHIIRKEIEHLNEVTHALAEQMMNTAVRSALKGTKV